MAINVSLVGKWFMQDFESIFFLNMENCQMEIVQ